MLIGDRTHLCGGGVVLSTVDETRAVWLFVVKVLCAVPRYVALAWKHGSCLFWFPIFDFVWFNFNSRAAFSLAVELLRQWIDVLRVLWLLYRSVSQRRQVSNNMYFWYRDTLEICDWLVANLHNHPRIAYQLYTICHAHDRSVIRMQTYIQKTSRNNVKPGRSRARGSGCRYT